MEGLIQTLPGVDDSVLRGEIDAGIFELGGRTPTRIIRVDQSWVVRIDWQMVGALNLLIDPASEWHVHILLESMGPQAESSVFSSACTQNWIQANPAAYSCEHVFAPGSVPVPHEGTVYRVVVSLVYEISPGTPGNMAGFVDLGLVHFYP